LPQGFAQWTAKSPDQANPCGNLTRRISNQRLNSGTGLGIKGNREVTKMRFPFILRAVPWGLLMVSLLVVSSARAQVDIPGAGAGSIFSSAGDSSVQNRYNKAKKGTNLNEWVRRLSDDDPDKRLEAIKSIGDSSDPKGIDYLIQGVGDADPRIQAKSIDYLGRLRAADSTPFLVQKLFTVGTREALRHRILVALGKIGDPRASHPILQYVMGDGNPDIRGTGIYAIGEIGDQSIRGDLQQFRDQENDPRLQRLCSEALIKIATRQPPQGAKDRSALPTALDAALQTEQR
jgi:HEAT repeat protein/PBS lyase HEAT-like repeat-containing protein